MRLALECEIHGAVTLQEEITVARGGTEYSFIRDADGRLASVRIIRPLAEPERVSALFKRDEHGTLIGIEDRMDDEACDEIIEEFKHLESMLAFSLHIDHLDWQCPTVSLLPENPEEAARVEFYNFRRTFTPNSSVLSEKYV